LEMTACSASIDQVALIVDSQMNSLTRKETGDRSEIHVANAKEIRCCARKLGISTDELRIIVEKVGNSAAAVRKELAMEAGDDASHT
jgi:3-oxoacyl-[acyl-carrier-protein] synthase III